MRASRRSRKEPDLVDTLVGWGANAVGFALQALAVVGIGIGVLLAFGLLMLLTGSGDPNADTRYPDALKYREVNRK